MNRRLMQMLALGLAAGVFSGGCGGGGSASTTPDPDPQPVSLLRKVSNAAELVGALLKLVVEPKAIGQVINIGNTEEITIRALADRIRELSGSTSGVRLIPYDEAYESGFEDMPRRVPHLAKIEGLIG
jgi:nucleoside-diphosphate-sugar epimerase